jgi:hypothetical protein
VTRSETLRLDVARWLVGDHGLACVQTAVKALDSGESVLRVGTRLRQSGVTMEQAAAVTGAAEARRRARRRWPDADRLLFTLQGLQQASDPAVSAWRAQRFRDFGTVEDRAAGIGGDTLALAATGASVLAIDRDEARLTLLRHNAAVRGVEVTTVVADALVLPAPTNRPVHADPDRRSDGRRARRLTHYEPPVGALLAHLAPTRHASGLAIVLSPAVALDDPDLPAAEDMELEFVQVGRELREAVAWLGGLRQTATARATATLLPAGVPPAEARAAAISRVRHDTVQRLPTGPVGEQMLELAPAAVRARLHDALGAEVDARRIATSRSLLTVDGGVPASPWWRCHPVETVLPARANPIRRWLRGVDQHPLELAVAGVDVDVDTFWRSLGKPARGPQGRRITLVRGDRGAMAIVTAPPES